MFTVRFMIATWLGLALPVVAFAQQHTQAAQQRTQAVQHALRLEQAIELAWQQDLWLSGSRLRQEALEAQSHAADTLPDPVLSVGVANLPLDTFDFNQEAMTQLKLGVSQMLPRGDTLALSKQRYTLLGQQQQAQRDERRAKVALAVAEVWLDAWRAQQSMRLIDSDRALFVDLVEVAESAYASALGSVRQQDVIRAQLELTRLDDRVAALRTQRDAALGKLGQWLGSGRAARVASGLPPLTLPPALADVSAEGVDISWLSEVLLAHPALLSLDQRIAASELEVDIARQQYRPQWGINAAYGYREDAPGGIDRADFFSVGISVELPLFKTSRQDRQLQSAQALVGVSRTDKALALRRMRAGFDSEWMRLRQLDRRLRLYDEQLLRQLHDQAEVALSAYTADDGDFSDAVRARIDELNAGVEALGIRAERLRSVARLNYYLFGLDGLPAESPAAPPSANEEPGS